MVRLPIACWERLQPKDAMIPFRAIIGYFKQNSYTDSSGGTEKLKRPSIIRNVQSISWHNQASVDLRTSKRISGITRDRKNSDVSKCKSKQISVNVKWYLAAS